jgi:hypothetical protein
MTEQAVPTPAPATPAPAAPELVEGAAADAAAIAAWEAKKPPAPEPAQAATPPAASAAPAAAPVGETPSPALEGAGKDGKTLEQRIQEYANSAARDVQEQLQRKRDAEATAAKAKAAEDRLAELEAKLREDPMSVISAHGWDFEALAKRAIGEGTPESVEVRRVREDITKLRAERDAELRTQREAAERADQERQVREWRAGIVPALKSKEGQFRHVLALMEPGELEDAVQTVVQRVYQGSGGARVLSVEEAASLLEQQAQQRFERIRTLVPTSAQPAPSQASNVQTTPPAPRAASLTNELTQHTPTDLDSDDLSDAALDARARAWAKQRGLTT